MEIGVKEMGDERVRSGTVLTREMTMRELSMDLGYQWGMQLYVAQCGNEQRRL